MGYFLTILARFSQYLLMGAGMQLVFSQTGIVYLGMPATAATAAYVLAIAEKFGMNPWLALVLALIAGLLIGLIYSYFYLKLSADAFTVLSFASISAMMALFDSWESVTNGTLGIVAIRRPAGFQNLLSLTLFVFVLAVLIVLFLYIINKSRFGRALRAYKESPVFLDALGLNSKSVAMGVIVISSFLFALGGCLVIWHVQSIDPTYGGLPMMIEVFSIGILALRSRIFDLVLAVAVVALIPELLRFVDMPSSLIGYMRVILYSILLIGLIYKFDKKILINNRSI